MGELFPLLRMSVVTPLLAGEGCALSFDAPFLAGERCGLSFDALLLAGERCGFSFDAASLMSSCAVFDRATSARA
jgi:hypothetical protein